MRLHLVSARGSSSPTSCGRSARADPLALLPDLYHRLEQLRRQRDAARLEAVVKLRTNPGGAEAPHHPTVLADAGFLKQENVLQRNDVLFHPHYLGNVCDAARPIAEARRLNK